MRISETYEGSKVPGRTKWIYSTVAVARDAAYTLVAMFLVTYIQYSGVLTRGLEKGSADLSSAFLAMYGVISALIIGYRIFDALNDPFMGVIIEKTHFKTGKYKPWILIGGVSNALVVFALFWGPEIGITGWSYVAWFAVFYLLWGLTFTMNDIAYWGMLPNLTSEERQRNTITTIMSIFCSVGQFAVAGLAPVLSGIIGYNVYKYIAIIVSVLFAVTQIILYLFLKEPKRDLEAEKQHEPAKFKDMFTVVKKNSQVRVMFFVLLVYYLGSSILNGLGLNYFYFAVNYSIGGTVMTIFTVVYGLGYILAQILFPILSKKFTRNQLLLFTFIALIAGYLAFFIYGLPLGNGNYIGPAPIVNGSLNIVYLIPLCLIGLVIFFAQGLFYMVLIIMMTNTIEYNEWKFGERKEAVIFSLRPLTTKFASAVQQGVLYLFLAIASLSGIIASISDLQNQNILGIQDIKDVNIQCDALVSDIAPWQTIVFKLGVAILPLVLFIIAFILIKKFYVIDEKMYNNMVKEIEERKANSHVNESSMDKVDVEKPVDNIADNN